ncbi:MAG: EamA/RhaT family transporter, partial [Bacteroidales bacterium]|nr:EamA/RhaT family transporter [Bacteroidales bacterium]
SMYNYIQPLVSSFVAVILGMDTFGWVKSLAALLIFLGVYVVTQSKSRAQMEKEIKRELGDAK